MMGWVGVIIFLYVLVLKSLWNVVVGELLSNLCFIDIDLIKKIVNVGDKIYIFFVEFKVLNLC